jgi:hypothetical protein
MALKPSAARAIRALNAAPNKRLSHRDFCKANGVKIRFHRQLVWNLLEQSLICRCEGGYELTFAGLRLAEEAA